MVIFYSNFEMGDPLGSFLRECESEDKARWEDLCWFVETVVDLGCYKWYQSRPLVVQCGSGTNQVEVGGPVTPGSEALGSDRQCTRHKQRTTPSIRLLGGGAQR